MRLAGAVLISCALLGVAPAFAQPASSQPSTTDVARARELFEQAEKAEAAEAWADALDKLQEVERIKATPVVYYHMGICEERLGRLGDALRHFEQSEALARAQNNAQLQALAAEKVEKTAPRVPQVTITITPKVDHTEVLLDGQVLPEGTRDLRLNASRPYKIEVRAPGRKPFLRQLFLAEGAREPVRVQLALLDAPATQQVTANTTEYEHPERSSPRSGPPLGTWVAGGAAVALGAGGLVTFLVSSGINGDARDRCPRTPGPPGEPDVLSATCLAEEANSDMDTVQTLDRVALGLWIGAGVAAGAAVTLWVLDPGAKKDGASAAPSGTQRSRLALEARPGGAALRGRF
ncbi:MAG: hypothetical protein WKG00_40320 [Polyangiaceae bacterium]